MSQAIISSPSPAPMSGDESPLEIDALPSQEAPVRPSAEDIETQDKLLNLALNDPEIAKAVAAKFDLFDADYQLLLLAMREGFGTTRQNYKAWLEDQGMIPIKICAHLVVFNHMFMKVVPVADAAGLFLRLDRRGEQRKKEVLINRFKAGDHSVLNGLEELGVDIWRLRAALILQRIGKKVYGCDDIGNGELFADAYRDELRYVTEWKRWILWDGKRWAADTREAVRVKAHGLLRHIMPRLAQEIKEDERRVKYLKHVAASHSSSKIDNMFREAAASMALSVADLDKDTWLFNLQNGTLDCRTGAIKPHDKGDLMTKISPCSYDPKAECPIWKRFLDRILAVDLIEFLQTAMGYSLTGSVREECMIILWGGGANGKSTFTETMLLCMGDYGQVLLPSVLLGEKQGINSDDIARLLGVRCAITNETKKGIKFNEERVKSLTGGDRIATCEKYGHPFEFDPTHKIWLATNYKPAITFSDEAMWRRTHLVTFGAKLTEAEKDRTLKGKDGKLAKEADGIMGWMILGLKRWLTKGLVAPLAVKATTAEYRKESDTFGKFIDDDCLIEADASVASETLFKAYQQWAKDDGYEHSLTAKGMAREMEERGFKKRDKSKGAFWEGLTLQSLLRREINGMEDKPF